jgi:hypothetical protein
VPGPLGLSDEAFWEDPHRNDEAAQSRLIDEGFEGILIDAPARVPLGRRETLPVCGVHAVSLRETQTLELRRAAIATAVRLETNEATADFAFVQRDRPPRGAGLFEPQPPLDDVPEGRTLTSFDAELRGRLGFAWEPGTLLLGLIVRERAPSRGTSNLEGCAAASNDPADAGC